MATLNNPNTAFEDYLYFQYLADPDSVTPEWKSYFEKVHGASVIPISTPYSEVSNGVNTTKSTRNNNSDATQDYIEEIKLGPNQELEALSNISSKIALNMEDSLQVPTATSFRTIPVKALDENRRIINKFLSKQKRSKVSFSHILLWAIVKALAKYPSLNTSFVKQGDKTYRVVKKSINAGLAVDVERKDGSRLLLVPNIKDAQKLNFSQFIEKFDDIILRARNNKLTLDELTDASVTLTNPGMIGTNASVPRLMKGQGLIIASGSIDYPAELQAVRPEVINTLAISKVLTITNTYDHRVIQGAESAEFLAYIHKLLLGEYHFYDQIFASLKITFDPIRWVSDKSVRKYGLDNVRVRVEQAVNVMKLINSYRMLGHLLASVNPLGIESYYYQDLDPSHYGLTIWDLDRDFPGDNIWGNSSYNLRYILELLRDTYSSNTGYEFMHIDDPVKKDWIKKRLEVTDSKNPITNEEQIGIYKKLLEAEFFENFLHTKFVGHKRFSLEGSESVIVMLEKIFEQSCNHTTETVVLGMAHRGRLTVLVNNIGKPLGNIFNEFEGSKDIVMNGSGDVKYHLGDEGTYVGKNGKQIQIILAPNPSHLEIINPVVLGMARAIEKDYKDPNRSKVMPVLIHGDAAFAGQGISQEVLNMSQLTGYRNNGTVHVIINNQIGFTTTPDDARSTMYCTDVAKMLQVPILHVNGNDPEAVARAAQFAVDYRNEFKSDVILDLISYRKYGHNEGDEPSYTQPLLYKKIRQMEPVRKIYEKQLLHEKILTEESMNNLHNEVTNKLNNAYDNRFVKPPKKIYNPEIKKNQTVEFIDTNVSKESLELITKATTTIPENFNANPKVIGTLKKRVEMFYDAKPSIDWGFAEALAFGSILLEGRYIRLSGEDSRRGTFSHRHAVLTDYINETDYIPLNNISNNQSTISIYDSPLSELAVLGYDYGYSVIAEKSLIMWEAQFGDFANMAQPIIDQFISCGEVKWGQTSNLVMLLPHGHDGQGPEHSSARLERFLQLCADDNMIVGNFTTPAQFFHALRRQIMLKSNVPLIIMTPKSMLRHPLAVSSVEDFTNGRFHTFFDDVSDPSPSLIKRVIFCNGKIYYDLLEYKLKNNRQDVALLRIEQLYPLDIVFLESLLDKYSQASEIIWVQEDHKNQGAWHFIAPEFYPRLKNGQKLRYCGRAASASSATGSSYIHAADQIKIVENAFNNF